MRERENEIAAKERRLGELKEMREKRKWKNGREENQRKLLKIYNVRLK